MYNYEKLQKLHARIDGASRPPLPCTCLLHADQVAARLQHVKATLLVLSGKGGVGKSTVTAHLAHALVAQGLKVGALDVDLTGPSLPKVLGVADRAVHKSDQGWVPVYTDPSKRLCVMSIGFLLAQPDDPVVWRGPKKTAVIKQFLNEVLWSDIDVLVIDTPPGTSDEHLATLEYLAAFPRLHAVLVSSPQLLSVSQLARSVSMLRSLKISCLGVFENMSGFVCPHCTECTNVFSSDGGRLFAEQEQIPFLGRIPIDPALAAAEDRGQSYLNANQTLAAIVQFTNDFMKVLSENKM